MVSLREQIYIYFKNEVNREWALTPNDVDVIMKFIGKRIDKIYKKEGSKISEDFDHGMYYLYQKIKEEILK